MKCQVCGSPLKHIQYGTRISVEKHADATPDLHVFLRFDCSKEDCGQKHLLGGPLSLGLLIAD